MKTDPNTRRAASQRERSLSPRRSGVEALESRIAPAAVATPLTFSYTDGDGDTVQVQITGKAGTAEFLDAQGGDVKANGGDLARIVITKPSPDFAISFADTNAPTGGGIGDNIIDLGVIVGAGNTRVPVIRGIFTAASSPGVSYQLGGYLGVDFSAGGGLGIVGSVVGDGVDATTDLDLTSLAKGTNISLGSVETGATMRVASKVFGNISIAEADGAVSLGTVGGRVQIGDIGGTLTLLGDLAGRLEVGSGAPPASPQEVTINGSVLATGLIQAKHDLSLNVKKDLGGAVATGGSLEATVLGGLKAVNILAGDDLLLDVSGPVTGSSIVAQHTVATGTKFGKGMSGSSIVGGTALNLEVTGSVGKSRFSGGTGNLDVAISGKVSGSQFLAGGDAIVSTGFTVDSSSILPDGRLTLTVGTPAQGVIPGVGDVVKSVIGSKSTSATVEIGGRVAGSQFTGGTDLDLTIGSSLSGSSIQASNDLILGVTTSIQGTRIAVGSDADVTIGGQLSGSTLLVSNNLDAVVGNVGQPVTRGTTVAAGITKSRLLSSDGSMTVTVVGPVAGSLFDSGQNATINIEDLNGTDPVTKQLKMLKAGSMGADVTINAPVDVAVNATGNGRISARITAGQNAVLDLDGGFGGAVSVAKDLTLNAKSVAVSAKQPIRVGGDLIFVVERDAIVPSMDVSGNVKDFRVGGALSGGINVSGNFVSGTTTAAATVVGGVVGSSTFLHIGGDLGGSAGAPEYIFGKGFAGRLEVGGDVITDLTFNGDVNRITVDGTIGPVNPGGVANAIADIIVKGKLGSLNSSSLFDRTTQNGGNFLNAAGATTGVLQADGGAPLVGPFLI